MTTATTKTTKATKTASVKNVGSLKQVNTGVYRMRSAVGQCFQIQLDGRGQVNIFRWNHVWRKWVLTGTQTTLANAKKAVLAGQYNLALKKERKGRNN